MAKNDAILLDGILADRIAAEPLDLGDAFELFAFEQVLKSYDLSRQELDHGWVDGKDDGGIDGFYTFVNGTLVQDPNKFVWPKRGVSIDVFIISCKHKDSFQQQPLNTLFPTIEELLDFEKTPDEFNGHYSQQLVRAREGAVQAFRKTASSLPKLHFHVVYASRGDEVEPNIEARGNQLKRIVSDFFSNAEVSLDFVGATELIALHRKSRFVLELPYSEVLAGDQGSYVLLVRLSSYAKFVSDDDGNLRRYLFDSNVRDFLGENRVNQDIASSLADVGSPDFWWLNNGVTILATSAIPLGKTAVGNALQLHDVQIVNGLQTTQSIHNHFAALQGGDDRSVLVKVIVSEDTAVRDKIIRATNNQSSVELASLTATDKIQRDIEEILERHDWFYERRKNYYKNIGKPAERFIHPLYLAVSMVAIVRKAPQLSSRLQSRFMRDPESYSAVFSDSVPILIWPKLASIMKTVDKSIANRAPKRKDGRRIVAGWRGAVALCALAEVFGTFAFTVSDLLSFDETQLLPARIEEIFTFLTSPRTDVPAQGVKAEQYRARVEVMCEEFGRLLSIQRIEVIGRWQLAKSPLPPIDATRAKISITSIKAPIQPLSAAVVDVIHAALPPQPWPPGMHHKVAKDLGLSTKILHSAVRELISAGRCYGQSDGVVFDKEGVIVATDPTRAAPHYKVGETFLR